MIWDFIQNQILGMKWLNKLIGDFLSLIGLDIESRLGGSIQFFIYDVIKITILLCTLIFMISYIQSYFPPERSKKIMGRFHGIGANIISALLGTVTPFCSCSSIPLFIGFTGAGLPIGVTFSFLISSPMVDLGSLILLMSIFGAKVAVVYVVFGLIIAVVGGTLIEKLHMEKYVEDFILKASSVDIDSPLLTKKERAVYAKEQVIATFKKVFPYIIAGVGIGAFLHNWIPETWIETVQDALFDELLSLFEEGAESISEFVRMHEAEDSEESRSREQELLEAYRGQNPSIRLTEEAQKLINALEEKKIAIGIISDGPPARQHKKLEVLGLDSDPGVKEIIITDELAGESNDPHIFRKPCPVAFEIMEIGRASCRERV